MKSVNKIKTFIRSLAAATTALPDVPEPKVPAGKGLNLPFLGRSKGAKIANASTNITNLVLSDHVRNESTMNETIKKLVLASPDLSHAVETKIRSAISDRFTAIAYNDIGVVDEAGTRMAQALIMRLNCGSYDYTQFTRTTDLRSLAASCLYDNLRYGAMSLELVLGSTRLPAYFKALPTRLLTWADNTPNTYPIYRDPAAGEIPLNYPTIFYSSAIQDQETPYSDSPLQAAIQACLWDSTFVDDLRRAATKNILQRLRVTINSEKYMAGLPLDVQTDKEKLKAHMDATVLELERQLASLQPDDSIVIFDILEADTISDANRSEDRSIEVLQALINGKIAAGGKILPAIIGRGESSNSASSEAMLFMKAISSVQLEWNFMFSRALTLAVRLLGFDVNVAYKTEEVNLRPELELESFRSQKQARELELLSLGMSDDIDTCIKLTGTLPPAGYTKLSGTMFKVVTPANNGNDYSNTSVDTAGGKTNSTQAQKDQK